MCDFFCHPCLSLLLFQYITIFLASLIFTTVWHEYGLPLNWMFLEQILLQHQLVAQPYSLEVVFLSGAMLLRCFRYRHQKLLLTYFLIAAAPRFYTLHVPPCGLGARSAILLNVSKLRSLVDKINSPFTSFHRKVPIVSFALSLTFVSLIGQRPAEYLHQVTYLKLELKLAAAPKWLRTYMLFYNHRLQIPVQHLNRIIKPFIFLTLTAPFYTPWEQDSCKDLWAAAPACHLTTSTSTTK